MNTEFNGAIFEGLLLGGPVKARGSAFGTAFDWQYGPVYVAPLADQASLPHEQTPPAP